MVEINTHAQKDLERRVAEHTGNNWVGWEAGQEFGKRVLDGEDPYQVSLELQRRNGIDTTSFEPSQPIDVLHEHGDNPYQLQQVGSDGVSMNEYTGGRNETSVSPSVGAVGSDALVRLSIFKR